jgi:aryl-alcohol dehydrogenase-like predicted oxidoreductase
MATPTAIRRRLGATDLDVFPLNLGGNVFGWTADRAASFAVLDAYREVGGNFLDTADVYSNWVPGHAGGESEEIIGAWLRERGCRGEMVVATKVGLGGPDLGGRGLRADQVRRGCESSLRRLGVDRIDLYYAHRDDPDTPQEETLGALDALVRAGKVRWLGASNYAAPRLRAALEASARGGLAAYAVVQPEYNLVTRAVFEGPLASLCAERGMGVCTYYGLASGFLTGKYAGSQPPGARAGRVQRYLDDPGARATLDAARAVARRRGATVAQVALAWQLHRPGVTTPIASATSPAQVRELAGAVAVQLDSGDLAALEGGEGAEAGAPA